MRRLAIAVTRYWSATRSASVIPNPPAGIGAVFGRSSWLTGRQLARATKVATRRRRVMSDNLPPPLPYRERPRPIDVGGPDSESGLGVPTRSQDPESLLGVRTQSQDSESGLGVGW